jgi:isatin hydrolase
VAFHFPPPSNAQLFGVSGEATPEFAYDARRFWPISRSRAAPGEWVVMRTDWYKRNGSEAEFLNANETGPHTPGPTAEAIEYLISKDITGWGSETIGTDAGQAGGMQPPFPAHRLMHKANRYGLASLCNLDRLPPKGAIIIAAPLKIEHGTGSPTRVLALVPRV